MKYYRKSIACLAKRIVHALSPLREIFVNEVLSSVVYRDVALSTGNCNCDGNEVGGLSSDDDEK